MITKFKLFENYELEKDLIDYVDSDLISDWYDDDYTLDAEEIATVLYPGLVWEFFDKEKFKKDFIIDMSKSSTYDDFDDNDFIIFIKENLTQEKKEKILELYNDNNYDETDEDSEKYTEFDIDFIDDLDLDQLKEVIEVDSWEDDFVEFITKYYYDDYDAEEIFSEFYGVSKDSFKNDPYSYKKPEFNSFGEYLWNKYNQYINNDKLISEYKKGEDEEYKKELAASEIYNNIDFQNSILENDDDMVLKLAELFENQPDGKNIGDTYDFQSKYIEKYIKQEISADEDDDEYEDEKNELIADALVYLDDNFILDDDIKKKYSEQMYKVNSNKYNL